MKKRLKQMDPGVIENALAVFQGIFVMSALFFLMLSVISGIQMKNRIDQTARRAVLLMETYGYLDEYSKSDLTVQLEESGVTDPKIRTLGYDKEGNWGEVNKSAPAAYGEKIEVEITGKVDIRFLKTRVRILRTSTSKN